MSRALPLAAALLVLAAFAPGAGAAEYFASGRSPSDSGYPLNPQMYCVLLSDKGGSWVCTVKGPVRNVEIVRVRMVGEGSVHVSVIDDVGRFDQPEQRAVVDCSRSCISRIPGGQHDDPAWTMRVEMDAPGTGPLGVPAPVFFEVSLEARAALDDDTEI